MTIRFRRFATIGLLAFIPCRAAQETIRELIWAPGSLTPVQPGTATLVEVRAAESSGFHFPYYLYVPKDVARTGTVRLLVEPNNTGQTTDDFEVHRNSAKRMASGGDTRRLADRLRVPLLVPVFPRPRAQWKIYTHSLDRDSLLVKEGPLARIDLQLGAMIEHARALLKESGIETKPRVWMYGFSASACFVNRFAALHPEAVRAVAAGALNALPMLPLERLQGVDLPFPLGVAGLKALTGAPFDREAYGQVSQYLYMGYLDRNDTFPFNDAWDDDERELIAKVFGREMMPDRWDRVRKVISTLEIPIQTVTYNGVAHATLPEMWDDVVGFFSANDGDGFGKIEPHQYPFVPYREIQEAHITGIYWKGDPNMPRYARLPEQGAFVIAIAEWMAGQDYQQLRTFIEKAGFDFDLAADGRETIHLDGKAHCGNFSAGDGASQGFYVCLDPQLADRIAPGAAYTLRSNRTGKAYSWSINAGIVLRRPDRK
jgi:hypothetical protein